MGKFIYRILSVVLVCFLIFGCNACKTQGADYTASFEYERASLDSPLRGIALWNTSTVKPLPYSLEYLPMPIKNVITASGEYDFSYSDTRLDQIATRGNHVIMRFLLWEPPESYLPPFFIEQGVKTVDVSGVAVADFSDQLLIDLLCEFIAAAGEYYDGDARIGFLQLGLMGRWGEWNYGSDYPSEAIPSAEQYNQIYAAFDGAFDTTCLQARNPNIGSPCDYAIGYHDDNFMFSTLGSGGGDFKYLCEQGGTPSDLWKTQSFGAELSGHENGDFFSTEEKQTRFTESVKYQNFSFMMWQRYDTILGTELWETHEADALELTRVMGYEFYAKSCSISRSGNELTVSVSIKNTGNAPFYYDWDGLVEFYSGENQIAAKTAKWELSKLMPNETMTFSITLGLEETEENAYDAVYLSIVNPLSKDFENAKPFRFANREADLSETKLILMKT